MSIVFVMTHIVGYPTYSTRSQFYERYDSVSNYMVASVVLCTQLVVLEIMEKEKGCLCFSKTLCMVIGVCVGGLYWK